jgi:hypothetical protein
MKTTLAVLLSLVALGTARTALADGQTPGPVYTTHVVDIVGRRVQPIAAVEVTRQLPTLGLHELKPTFALGIEAGVARAPF